MMRFNAVLVMVQLWSAGSIYVAHKRSGTVQSSCMVAGILK